MKRALVLLFALGLVAGVAGLYLYVTPERIVKTAIVQIGSGLAGTPVTVDHVEMSQQTGAAALRGLHIANPDGYGAADAIRFDDITLMIDVVSIDSDPVIIRKIVIDRPFIRFEQGDGGDNLAVLRDTVASRAGENGGAAPGITPRLVIDELVLTNGRAWIASAGGREVGLPEIKLFGIGTPGAGATPAEVVLILLESLRTAAEDASDR